MTINAGQFISEWKLDTTQMAKSLRLVQESTQSMQKSFVDLATNMTRNANQTLNALKDIRVASRDTSNSIRNLGNTAEKTLTSSKAIQKSSYEIAKGITKIETSSRTATAQLEMMLGVVSASSANLSNIGLSTSKTADEMAKLNKQTGSANKTLKSIETSSKKAEKSLADLAQRISIYSMVTSAASRITGIFFSKIGELIEYSQRYTTQSAIYTGDIDATKNATLGLVGAADLMASKNRLLGLGINVTDGDFIKLAASAQKMSVVMGTDTKSALESLSIALGRQSRLVADNLGVIISAKSAQEKYAKSIGKTVDQLSEEEKKVAWQNEFIEKLTNKADTYFTRTNTLSVKLSQVWVNFSDVFAKIFSSINKTLGSFFSSTESKLDELRRKQKSIIEQNKLDLERAKPIEITESMKELMEMIKGGWLEPSELSLAKEKIKAVENEIGSVVSKTQNRIKQLNEEIDLEVQKNALFEKAFEQYVKSESAQNRIQEIRREASLKAAENEKDAAANLAEADFIMNNLKKGFVSTFRERFAIPDERTKTIGKLKEALGKTIEQQQEFMKLQSKIDQQISEAYPEWSKDIFGNIIGPSYSEIDQELTNETIKKDKKNININKIKRDEITKAKKEYEDYINNLQAGFMEEFGALWQEGLIIDPFKNIQIDQSGNMKKQLEEKAKSINDIVKNYNEEMKKSIEAGGLPGLEKFNLTKEKLTYENIDNLKNKLIELSKNFKESDQWMVNLKERATSLANDKMWKDLTTNLKDLAKDGLSQMATGMWDVAIAMKDGSVTFKEGMQDLLSSMLMMVAKQATVLALMETANGIATMFPGASIIGGTPGQHFAAAAAYAAVAGVAGAGGILTHRSTSNKRQAETPRRTEENTSFGRTRTSDEQTVYVNVYFGQPNSPLASLMATQGVKAITSGRA